MDNRCAKHKRTFFCMVLVLLGSDVTAGAPLSVWSGCCCCDCCWFGCVWLSSLCSHFTVSCTNSNRVIQLILWQRSVPQWQIVPPVIRAVCKYGQHMFIWPVTTMPVSTGTEMGGDWFCRLQLHIVRLVRHALTLQQIWHDVHGWR